MRRITKHDAEKADTLIAQLEAQIAEIEKNLANLVEYTIEYLKKIKKKYGAGRERKTELRAFDTIEAAKVAVANVKLYMDKTGGFIGHGLKKGEGEYICDCSDIDDIIVFLKDGTFTVQRIQAKSFIGKDIVFAGVWKKRDNRTIYNLIYKDGLTSWSFMKRFAVTSITRDKFYPITHAKKGSEIMYFSANSNGEAEKISVYLRSNAKLRKTKLEIDLAKLAVKSSKVKGNLVTKFPIRKIEKEADGVSTLAARQIWLDENVMRLNDEGRGRLLGNFSSDDKIIEISKNGELRLLSYDFSTHFDTDSVLIEKFNSKRAVSIIYYDGDKKKHFIKRFLVEKNQKSITIISEAKGSSLTFVSLDGLPQIELKFAKEKGQERENELISIADFISVKGIKASGNQLSGHKIQSIKILSSLPFEDEQEDEDIEDFEEFEDVENIEDEDNNDAPKQETQHDKDESEPISDESGQISLF